MNIKKSGISDFAFTFKLYHYTFRTRKPEYTPQIFEIFHTYSTSIWIAIILLLLVMLEIYYTTLKWKYSFDKILLHTFAIFLKQGSILRPFLVAENLLVYFLFVGAMFLGLFYETTVLFFLTIPSVIRMNDVTQLAKAVANGAYHCATFHETLIHRLLLRSKREDLRIIGRDL